MSDNFYIEFEKKFRGSSDFVKARMSVYIPIIEPLRQLDTKASALDLGCGRGEWLQLLTENNFNGQGFDLDERMLEHSSGLGLNVTKLDAITALKNTQPASQVLITAFHLIEHLNFDDLRELIDLAFVALIPGGFLILETPNPENMMVATLNFYLDPTHLRPIPPLLLEHACQYSGFEKTKVIRMGNSNKIEVGLNDILGYTGIAADYSVIAQKKFDSTKTIDFNAFEEIIDAQYPFESFQAYDAIRRNEYHQLAESIKSLELKYHSLVSSLSWRITRPLRALKEFLQKLLDN